jgi:hypothetical protein
MCSVAFNEIRRESGGAFSRRKKNGRGASVEIAHDMQRNDKALEERGVQMGGATEPNSEQNPLVTFCEQSNER